MAQSSTRRIACARCGCIFDCGMSADCWCAAEPYRLPLTKASLEDCLCRDCMHKAAALAESRGRMDESSD